MRVMVSLNLADIMTATRPITPHETQNNEVDATDPCQESQPPINSEPAELIE
jgi:hypothetical protein